MPRRDHQGEFAGTCWAPAQYLKFSEQRLRPALELLDRATPGRPGVIYDLGCGSGHITRLLAQRWPSSEVYGVDSSQQMLAEAASEPSAVRWIDADIRSWVPKKSPDLVYSNAALHWVGGHRELFLRLVDCLNTGGCLAVQMPLSWNLPSHRLMRETLASGGPGGAPIGDSALLSALSRNWVGDADSYREVLSSRARRLDIWETQYVHSLEGEDSVFEWVSGSGLRPVINGLSGKDRIRFLEIYRERLREAYPRDQENITIYPFPRLFIVASV